MVFVGAFEFLEDGTPGGYRTDVGRVVDLLVGEQVYTDEFVALRELIQNSVDAHTKAMNSIGDIEIRLNAQEGYFEVEDWGGGISLDELRDNFAVIGGRRQINERLANNKWLRKRLIARFGVGFISTFRIAYRVLVWTRSSVDHSIFSFEINTQTKEFAYNTDVAIRKNTDVPGTVVRVYIQPQVSDWVERVLQAFHKYCRHHKSIRLFVNDQKVCDSVDRWETEGASFRTVQSLPDMRVEIGLRQGGDNGVHLSSSGIYVGRNLAAITPQIPSTIVCDLDVLPHIVDLDIAREKVLNNDSAMRLRECVCKSAKFLLEEASQRIFPGGDRNHDKKLQELVAQTLMFFVVEGTPDSKNVLDPHRAASLLRNVLHVEIGEQQLIFADAIERLQKENKTLIYTESRFYTSSMDRQIVAQLRKSGELVVRDKELAWETAAGARVESSLETVLRKLVEFEQFNVNVVAGESPGENKVRELFTDDTTSVNSVAVEVRNRLASEGVNVAFVGIFENHMEANGVHYVNNTLKHLGLNSRLSSEQVEYYLRGVIGL